MTPLELAFSVLLAAVGLGWGVFAIWWTVKWLNRRDDPRHSQRPSDPP